MSNAPLTVTTVSLRKGPVRREWHLEDPPAVLGALPGELSPIHLELEIGGGPAGGYRVRGGLRATMRSACRRCIAEVEVTISADVDVWYRAPQAVQPGEESVWPLDPTEGEIDLADAIREEVWMAAPDYVECRDDCAGLCARCGARLGDETCTCPPPAPDPRWAALGQLEDAPPEP